MSLLTLTPAEFCAATEACEEGREFALQHASMADVWDKCPRPDWLLWITDKLNQRPDDRTLRLFAVWCARHTPFGGGRVMGDLLTDPRSLAALEVAERYAHGQATAEELAVARGAAGAAAWGAARAAAEAAAWGAAEDAAEDAAWDAAWDAAEDAARGAARAAAEAAAWGAAEDAAEDAAWDARAAAWDAARAAAEDAARKAQADQFRHMVPNPFPQ